jgi:hypothetical protein
MGERKVGVCLTQDWDGELLPEMSTGAHQKLALGIVK